MVQVNISELPTTQFTVGVVAKAKGVTLKEAREALDALVSAGKLTVKVAGSGARNYKRKSTTAKKAAGRKARPAKKATKKRAPAKRAAKRTTKAVRGKGQAFGRKARAKANGKTAGTSAPRGTTVRFVVNGKAMPDSQNKLSSVAWYHTAGIETDHHGDDLPRISVTDLRALLAKEGVKDPGNTAGWKVTLPNGKTVETKSL